MYTKNQRNWPSATANGITLIDPVVVSFNGDVVLLARESGKTTDKLYYNVRHDDPNAENPDMEYSGWYELDMATVPSSEVGGAPSLVGLRELGAGLITVTSSAHPSDPADLPFTALSDERYIYIFRPSAIGTFYLDRFILLQVPAPQEDNQVRRDSGSTKPPSYQLERIWESRFRVSRKQDTPADDRDVIGYRDMLGAPFIEPTLELGVLPRSTDGRFAVVLLPTSEVDKRRWYFFVAAAGQIQVMSWPQSSDGLFDFLPPAKTKEPAPPSAFTFLTLYEDGQALTFGAGIAVRVYAEQDQAENGTKLRRAMRLMVTVPVSGASIGLTRALAVFDFNILPSGQLPAPLSLLQSPLLDGKLVNGKFVLTSPLPAQFPLPQSVVHLAHNSTIYAYLLGGVQPSATPFILDGGDGLVHCYYAGMDGVEVHPFLVAQYNPEVQRPSVSLAWAAGDQNGTLDLIAQRPGTSLNQLKVTVTDSKAGVTSADLCDLTVDYGVQASGIGTEQWTGLPRELTGLMEVLNGNASGELSARAVQEGSVRYFDYAGIRSQARLPLSSAAQPAGWLTLVSTRLDLALAQAQISAGNAPDKVTLVLHFAQGNKNITQTWENVPAAADDLRAVLRGDAASFSYIPNSSDPWVLALSAAGGTSSMLFYAAASASSGNTSIEILAGSKADKVNVRLVSGGAGKGDKTWPDLPADSTLLAKALLAIPEVTAVFPVISSSDSTGPVAVQVSSKPADLRTLCVLFGTLPPDIAAPVVAGTVAAIVLQAHSQPLRSLNGNPLVNRLVALSAVAAQFPNNGIAAKIGNQTIAATAAAGNGAWVAAKPLYALNLPGGAAMTVPTNRVNFDRLTPSKTFTLETWLRPNLNNLATGDASARVLSFNGTAAGNTPTWKVAPSSFLSVFAQPAIQFGLIKSSAGTPTFGYVQPSGRFEPDQAFTWEIWVKAAAQVSPQGQNGALFQLLDPNNPTNCAMDLSLDGTLTPVFTVNDGNNPSSNKASTGLQANVWTHLAVTGQCTNLQQGQWLVSLYVNGQDAGIKDMQLKIVWNVSGPNALFIGGNGGAVNASAAASLAEVRYWQIQRTRTDIQDSLYFTLSGTEPGLVGYWPLDDKKPKPSDPWVIRNLCRVSGSNLSGNIQPSQDQAVISSADGAFLAIASGIGGAPPMKVNAFLRSTHWNHVAVSYRAGNCVRLNAANRAIVNCGHDNSLNVTDAFSVEAWVQVDPSSQPTPQTFVAKWGKDENQQGYWLGLNSSGQLNLQVQYQYTDKNKNEKTLQLVNASATGNSLRDGLPHHVAATVRTETKTDDSNKNNIKTYVIVTVTFYVDGKVAGSSAPIIPVKTPFSDVYTSIVQSTTTDLTLGAAVLSPAGVAANTAPEAQMYLTGMLTGVVIWSRAIDSKDITNSIQQGSAMQRDGAIVAWWFREQAGVDAVDSVAGLVAKLSSNDLWAVYNRLSELLFYANGRQLLGADNLTDSDAAMSKGYPNGPAQFTLGGYQNGANLEASLATQLNEVRLWQQVRAPRQIADIRFSRLVGDETGLTGYWNFDEELLADESLFGNNGVMWNNAVAPYVLSTAPVSNEGPAVLNVYGGQPTEFQQRLNGSPAVIEFSEVTREPTSALEPAPKDGQAPKLLGSLSRAYYYTTGTVNLTTGFYAGALRLVYLGQVQTDATLIGYIEGAPPVPSENLTRPYYGSSTGYFGYFNASSITFTDTETTTITFNSSYSNGSTVDQTTSGGFALASRVTLDSPNPLGLVPAPAARITTVDLKIGAKEKGGFSTQDVSIENSTSSWALVMTDTLALRGNWESDDPAKFLNPQVGRRFLPDNVGYALVSSLTADVYLTYNAATGAAVGRSVVPNPYIPPDSNIITFLIDPTYTKNGTLDGKVGLYNDPDSSVPGSYFKPIESYQLKRQIARKAVDAERYYEQFNAYKRALSSTKSLDDQEPNRLVERTAKGALARKGIANTYVWSAAGGMHTEQEQFTDQFTTTFTGGYNVNNQFGLVTDFKGVGGIGVQIGGFFTVDWMGGFKIDITATKTRTKASAFGLNVLVTGEPALLGGWDGKNYPAKPVPGKVASYRFTTFYLPPDGDNGNFLIKAVVDPVWLRSNEPDAVTLRAARVGNPAWRILHRVTYVNRIPPGLDNTPNQTLPAPIARVVDLENNEVLIELILTALGTNLPTPPNVGAAVAAVLNPQDPGGNYPKSKLSALVPWWDDFLKTTREPNRNQANYQLLQGLQLDILKYVLIGLADGTFKANA